MERIQAAVLYEIFTPGSSSSQSITQNSPCSQGTFVNQFGLVAALLSPCLRHCYVEMLNYAGHFHAITAVDSDMKDIRPAEPSCNTNHSSPLNVSPVLYSISFLHAHDWRGGVFQLMTKTWHINTLLDEGRDSRIWLSAVYKTCVRQHTAQVSSASVRSFAAGEAVLASFLDVAHHVFVWEGPGLRRRRADCLPSWCIKGSRAFPFGDYAMCETVCGKLRG